MRRKTKRSKNNTSSCTGVDWKKDAKKWRVRFNSKHIGYFKLFQDAIRVRWKAEAEFKEA